MSSYAASDLDPELWHLEPKRNDKNRLLISLRKSSRSSQTSSICQTNGTNPAARRWNGEWSNLEMDPSVAALLSSASTEDGPQIMRSGRESIMINAKGDSDKTVARVRQTTKGFLVRLLKGVAHPVEEVHLQNIATNDIAELPTYREAVELGTYSQEVQIAHHAELDAQPSQNSPRLPMETREREGDRLIDGLARTCDDTNSIMESELEASLEERSRERQLIDTLASQPQNGGELSSAMIRRFVSPVSGPLGEYFVPSGEYTASQPASILPATNTSCAEFIKSRPEIDAKVDTPNPEVTQTTSLEHGALESSPILAQTPVDNISSHTSSNVETPVPDLAKPVDWVTLLSEPNVRRHWTLLQRRNLFRRDHVQFKKATGNSLRRVQTRSQVMQRAEPDKVDVVPSQELEFETFEKSKSMIIHQSLLNARVRSTAASLDLFKSLVAAATSGALHVTQSFQNWAQPEMPISPGHIRVRWTCICGQRLFDDFQELRPGAARKLEMKLNRNRDPIAAAQSRPSTDNSSSSRSSNGNSIFSGGSFKSKVSSATSVGSAMKPQNNSNPPNIGGLVRASSFHTVSLGAEADVLWLLTCVPEGRFTPKLAHVSMDPSCVRSDRDVALALKERYTAVHKAWYRFLKLRGLKRVDFVQFEVHRNRFADIRARPDMPQADSKYEFEDGQLVPPVGTHYLLHLIEHPEDYETENILYQRCPKKRGKLDVGVGWGVELVEEFMPARVWAAVVALFLLSSVVFAVVWVVKKHDVQGAFAVTAWMCMFSTLVLGWIQACVE